jgi:hypothetical protein
MKNICYVGQEIRFIIPLIILLCCTFGTAAGQVADSTQQLQIEKFEPSEPEQKWCDGIEIENDRLIFKGIHKGKKVRDAIIPFVDFLSKFGIADATTKDIVWKTFRIINGEKKAFFVIEKNGISVLVTSNPDFEKNDDTWGKGLVATDKTKIFLNEGAIFITEDGSMAATTSTTLLIICSGKSGEKREINYTKTFGETPL